MAMRTFRTSEGVTWHVWNVVPGLHDHEERRLGYDRRNPEPIFRYTGPERRVKPDRRTPPGLLSPRLARGWLAFESPTEKRRLAPIPQFWERLPETELERLCGEAVPVSLIPPLPPREEH
jgi:hypothetical protein